MLTREVAIDTAEKFISEIKKLGYNPEQAYIFGSVISGNIHKYSDIDLALWDKMFTGALPFDIEKLSSLLLKFRTIELHTYPANETEDQNPFIEVIKKTGVKI